MALIVEDGTIVAGAESYASVSYADAYHLARGNTTWAALATGDKEIALRKATDYMLQVYRKSWMGSRVSTTQTLDWPRYNVYIDNLTNIDSNIVPGEVKNACCELALKSSSGTVLLPDQKQAKEKVKVGPVEVTYDKSSKLGNDFNSIDAILSIFFSSNSGIGINRVLVRV